MVSISTLREFVVKVAVPERVVSILYVNTGLSVIMLHSCKLCVKLSDLH